MKKTFDELINMESLADTDLDEAVEMARRLKKTMKTSEDRYRALQAKLIDSAGTAITKDKRFTIVAGEKAVINEESLRKRVGASIWNKITTKKLDKKKLEALIAADEIDMKDVAAVSTMQPISPYIKWK